MYVCMYIHYIGIGHEEREKVKVGGNEGGKEKGGGGGRTLKDYFVVNKTICLYRVLKLCQWS